MSRLRAPLGSGNGPEHRPRDLPGDFGDFFVERDGVRYAGVHLMIDLWDAEGLDDLGLVEATLRDCVAAAGATLLHI